MTFWRVTYIVSGIERESLVADNKLVDFVDALLFQGIEPEWELA